jgi:hypothetical protein
MVSFVGISVRTSIIERFARLISRPRKFNTQNRRLLGQKRSMRDSNPQPLDPKSNARAIAPIDLLKARGKKEYLILYITNRRAHHDCAVSIAFEERLKINMVLCGQRPLASFRRGLLFGPQVHLQRGNGRRRTMFLMMSQA